MVTLMKEKQYFLQEHMLLGYLACHSFLSLGTDIGVVSAEPPN